MQMHAPMDKEGLACLHALGLDQSAAVLVVGMGKTGYSVGRFLAGQGLRFAVTDSRSSPPFLAEFTREFPDAAVFPGGFQPAAFNVATHLIVSPGVSLDEPAIVDAVYRGAQVLGELDVFACMARAPIVAVTGANGKSTVTTLVGLMAQAGGLNVKVGGNLGTPMLDLLDEAADLYVLELSSFQLETSRVMEAVAATVLNISPDHLDRYDSIQDYADTKKRIFHGTGIKVLNLDDPMVEAMAGDAERDVWFSVEQQADYGLGLISGEEWLICRGEPLMKCSEVRLKGRHNLANALAALALGDAAGIGRAAMVSSLRKFEGLEHRMQYVGESKGVVWINDSKATNVGACTAALAGLSGQVVLIAGGDGKGADFRVLRPVVEQKVRAAVLMGRDAALLEAAIGDLVPVVRVGTMREAVRAAHGLAASGDVVLLAPACASLDQYKDYQERGRMFVKEMRSLTS